MVVELNPLPRQPKLSIIIPIYNSVEFLDQTIQSVLSQSYQDREIIVINDGSHRDATDEIAKICARYPSVILFHQENRGQSLARKHGLDNSCGEFVLFLDGDDLLLEGALDHLVTTLEVTPTAVASYGGRVLINAKGALYLGTGAILPQEMPSGDLLRDLLAGNNPLAVGGVCIRRSALQKIDFDVSLRQGEDWIMWCRLAAQGEFVFAGRRTTIAIRKHRGNTSENQFKSPANVLKMFNYVFSDSAIVSRFSPGTVLQLRGIHARIHYKLFSRAFATERKYFRALYYFFLQTRLPLNSEKTTILHIVYHFHAGGAERLLSGLLEHSDSEKFDHLVVSLADRRDRIRKVTRFENVQYYPLSFQHGRVNIFFYLHLIILLLRTRPQLVKTWLAPSNIIGGIAAWITRLPVVWGIHHPYLPEWKPRNSRLYLALSRLIPKHIICCSANVERIWRSAGAGRNNLITINNGVDSELFRFRSEGRERIRRELQIPENSIVIGMAAEHVPVKRHAHFLAAASELKKTHPSLRILLCGRAVEDKNPDLKRLVEFLNLEGSVTLLGIRDDMADFYSALDINTLNSRAESFGLSIAEAIACETYCVASDVGVIADLLDSVGEVYPVTDDISSLVSAWKAAIALSPAEKGARLQRGRERIIKAYSIKTMARSYDNIFANFAKLSGSYEKMFAHSTQAIIE